MDKPEEHFFYREQEWWSLNLSQKYSLTQNRIQNFVQNFNDDEDILANV